MMNMKDFVNVEIGENKFIPVANDPSVIPLVKYMNQMKCCGICANSFILNEPHSPGRLVCSLNEELLPEVNKMSSCLDWELAEGVKIS